ncbi:YCF48-related protein [Winogradskyella poriferorum]|uniref:YCF48-related protein n=1 Tax=Winogradskyella poriferorum TaxID=307627 RepID=UPI003D65B11E
MKNHYLKAISLLIFYLFFIHHSFAQWDVVDINTTNNLYDVHFIDKDTGWIAGDNTVYKTVDAGTNWTEISIPKWFKTSFFSVLLML